MKQILGILSVIIVLGAVIFVFFGHATPKEKTKNTSEDTKETSVTVSTTMTTTAVD